jgi:hypothetical protein
MSPVENVINHFAKVVSQFHRNQQLVHEPRRPPWNFALWIHLEHRLLLIKRGIRKVLQPTIWMDNKTYDRPCAFVPWPGRHHSPRGRLPSSEKSDKLCFSFENPVDESTNADTSWTVWKAKSLCEKRKEKPRRIGQPRRKWYRLTELRRTYHSRSLCLLLSHERNLGNVN